MPNTPYVRKSAARNVIVGVFVFYMLALGVGLQLVKMQAEDSATHKATRLALATLAVNTWNTNHTGCAIRKIVAPQLASLNKARHDMTIAKSARRRAEKTYHKTALAISIWTTIPADFNCKTLPQRPPPLPHNG